MKVDALREPRSPPPSQPRSDVVICFLVHEKPQTRRTRVAKGRTWHPAQYKTAGVYSIAALPSPKARSTPSTLPRVG